MFCPKCGTQNPDNGKFCRACGTDLAVISEALTGNSSNKTDDFGLLSPRRRRQQSMQTLDKKGKSINWESAMAKLFSGLAFLIISLILSSTDAGRGWWFWMLIPAFSIIGGAVAQIIQLKGKLPHDLSSVNGQINSNNRQPIETGDVAQIERLANSGRKIEAIKIHREMFGSNLPEAEIAVERIADESRNSEFQSPEKYAEPLKSIYDTGELAAPPSVTESTTRHLELNKEGETMTLPRNDKQT